MPSKKNIDLLADINQKKDRAKSAVFVHYRGLTGNQLNQLRDEIKQAEGEILVTKNTLLRKAFANDQLNQALVGPTAVIFAYEDEIAPLKILTRFAKNAELPTLTGGFMDQRALSPEDVTQLSLLPGKLELQAKLVGSLNAPLFGMVNVLAGNIRNLIYALKAIEDNKNA